MPTFGGLTRFLDKYLFSYALGTAAGPSLEPFVQELANEANAAIHQRPLEVGDVADIVAEDVELQSWGRTEALQTGFDNGRFDALLRATENGPGLQALFELWRRGNIDQGGFVHGLRKLKLEPLWDGPLEQLRQVLLSPAELANARQQGYVDEGRQKSESQLQGVDNERAELLFLLSGLPPGVDTGLEMLRRNIIDSGVFAEIVREGHTKTKYTDELLQLRFRILEVSQLANMVVRGWLTFDQAADRATLQGWQRDEFQLIVDTTGRPPGPGQLQTAFNRGIIDRARFDHGIRESDVRPEWLDVEFALRRRYPSLFQLRRAVQDGSITPERARVILGYEGYEDQDADGLIASWSGAATPAGGELTKAEVLREYESAIIDRGTALGLLTTLGESPAAAEGLLELADYRYVRSALTAAMTKVRTLYVGYRISRAQASNEIDQLGISSVARDRALSIWDQARDVNTPLLTPAQIATAAQRGIWSGQQSYDELRTRGYSDRDARTLLALHRVTL